MNKELLPCPFCGGEAERIDFGPGSGDNEGGSCIACTKCQSSGPVEFGYKENFVSNWNHRHTAQAVAVDDAMVRRLADHLKGKLFYGTLNDAAREERAREMLQAAMGGNGDG